MCGISLLIMVFALCLANYRSMKVWGYILVALCPMLYIVWILLYRDIDLEGMKEYYFKSKNK